MKKFLKRWKKQIIFGLIIIFVAALLRLLNLTSLPIFGDEAIYIRWAQVMRAEPSLRFLPLTDGKQPLFMWTAIPFLKAISDPLIAGRLVSVVSGIGTLIGVFVLAYILYGSKVCNLAGLIYAVSPIVLFFDRMALADAMLVMFIVWTLVFVILFAREKRLDWAMLSGFALGGALLTKSPATFYVWLFVPTALFVNDWKRRRVLDALKILFLSFVALVIAYGLYNILRLGQDFQMIAIRNQDYIYPLSHILNAPLNPLISHLKDIANYFWLMGPALLIPLFAWGLYLGYKKFRKETLILFVWSFAPLFAVAEYSKTMTVRYILFTIPFILIISSLVLYAKSKRLKKYALALVAVFVLQAIFVDVKLLTKPQSVNLPRSERSGYLEEWTSGYGIRETASYIKSEYLKNPEQQIVVGTEGFFGTLPDGLQIYFDKVPNVTVIGIGQPVLGLPQSLKESRLAGNKTYLVVNSTRLKADPKKIGLTLVANFPKAYRPDGTREELLLFSLN